MQEDSYKEDMAQSALSSKTIQVRISALKRIESQEGVDLDEEFARDSLAGLLNIYSYSQDDAQNQRPNPTKINIGENSVLDTVRWYRSHLNQYRKWRMSGSESALENDEGDNGSRLGSAAPDEVDNHSNQTFALEADMQAALRREIAQLEAGLTIIDGGAERKVDSGFIDILARDSAGCIVVIELKAGVARDSVIAQTLGYMGDIAEDMQSPVRGIIVAADFGKRLRSAARAVPNLALKTYSYSFNFK